MVIYPEIHVHTCNAFLKEKYCLLMSRLVNLGRYFVVFLGHLTVLGHTIRAYDLENGKPKRSQGRIPRYPRVTILHVSNPRKAVEFLEASRLCGQKRRLKWGWRWEVKEP
jgi:hypothetical protein